jgi:hypothetical protein
MHMLSNECKPMLAALVDLLAPVSTSEFIEAFRSALRSGIRPTRAETLDKNVTLMRDRVLVPRQFYISNEGNR